MQDEKNDKNNDNPTNPTTDRVDETGSKVVVTEKDVKHDDSYMLLDDYQKSIETMTEEELAVLIQDTKRNRETISETKVKAIRAKAKKVDARQFLKGMTTEEKKKLMAEFGVKSKE